MLRSGEEAQPIFSFLQPELATSGQNQSSFAPQTYLHRAMSTEAEFQRQNERFELLLNLATGIASSLDLKEVLRSIAANMREVIHADAVGISLPDTTSGKSRLFAVDFPHGKGALKEELLVTPSPAAK